jgi:mono/diheme cytochrome c family protein
MYNPDNDEPTALTTGGGVAAVVAAARSEYPRLVVRRPGARVGLLIAVVVLLVAIAATLGWVVGNQTASKTKTVVAPAQTTMPPAGHMGGPNLPIAEIGDPARGTRLWQAKRCSDCHSYAGRGGEDAPPLDFMRGHMSAREIADMSGQIWDHLPAMLPHFREEKIPVPTFTQGEMADLIAFLHSGKGGKAGAPAGHPGMTGMQGMGGHMGAAPGKGVFLSAGCGACHTFAAAGTKATVGPNLDTTLRGRSSAFVRESILDPNAMIAAGYQRGVMPTTYRSQLTSRQIANLVGFLLKRRT